MADAKELVNKAVASTINTLSLLGITMEARQPGIQLTEDVVHVQIQFIGDYKGYFILETSKSFGIKLANVLLAGMMEVTDIDEMCMSVLGEVCNMVSGNISTAFAEAGVMSDIKPPQIEVRKNALSGDKATSILNNAGMGELINTYFISV